MPQEKDVQYYSELVQREVSCKDLSFGCKVLITRHLIPGYIVASNKTQYNLYVDVVTKNKIGKTFVQQLSLNDYIEILGHEMRPHHRLLRGGKIGFPLNFRANCSLDFDLRDERRGEWHKHIPRDLTKPFSGQSDSTKIELGKLVEGVLISKKK